MIALQDGGFLMRRERREGRFGIFVALFDLRMGWAACYGVAGGVVGGLLFFGGALGGAHGFAVCG